MKQLHIAEIDEGPAAFARSLQNDEGVIMVAGANNAWGDTKR